MNAAVSGRLGLAFVVDGEECHSRSSNAPSARVSREPWEFDCLFVDATDVEFIDNIDSPELEDRLVLESNKAKALHFSLAILDSELSEDLRTRLAAWLNEVDNRAFEYAQNVLFAAPLPAEADFHIAHSLNGRAKRISSFYSLLQQFQPTISFVRHCWQTLVMSARVRKDCERILVKEGAFKLLVENCLSEEARKQAFCKITETPALDAVDGAAALIGKWSGILDHLVPILVEANPEPLNPEAGSGALAPTDSYGSPPALRNKPFFINVDAPLIFLGVRDWIMRSTMTEPAPSDVLWELGRQSDVPRKEQRDSAVRAWDQAKAWLTESDRSVFQRDDSIADWLGSGYGAHSSFALHYQGNISSEGLGIRKRFAKSRSCCRVFLSFLESEANVVEERKTSSLLQEQQTEGVEFSSIDFGMIVVVVPTVFLWASAELGAWEAHGFSHEKSLYQAELQRNDPGETTLEKWLFAGRAQLIKRFYSASRWPSLDPIQPLPSSIWGYSGTHGGIRYAWPYPFIRFIVCDQIQPHGEVSIVGLARTSGPQSFQGKAEVYSGELVSNYDECFERHRDYLDAVSQDTKLEALKDLYVDELRNLYSAENQLIEALPKMARTARNRQLSSTFDQHLEQTKRHAKRLEQILKNCTEPTDATKCEGMERLIAMSDEVAGEDTQDKERDVALIGVAQSVEHYEIAGYGIARSFAELLGDKEGARLLDRSLREESETDKKLAKLAQSVIKLHAKTVPNEPGKKQTI